METLQTVADMLAEINFEIKPGGLEEKYNFYRKGPHKVLVSKYAGGAVSFHTDYTCNYYSYQNHAGYIPNMKVLVNHIGFLVCPLKNCGAKDLDVTRIIAFYQIALLSKGIRKATGYKNSKTHIVKQRIRNLNKLVEDAFEALENFSENVSLKPSSYKNSIDPDEALKYYEKTLKVLKKKALKIIKNFEDFLTSDEMKEKLDAQIRKELNGSARDGFFDERKVLVGVCNNEKRVVIDEIHSIYAVKEEETYTVSVMPQYVYDFYQRICFKASKDLKWVGYIPIPDDTNESIIETAASLWDPHSSDGLNSLYQAYEVARTI